MIYFDPGLRIFPVLPLVQKHSSRLAALNYCVTSGLKHEYFIIFCNIQIVLAVTVLKNDRSLLELAVAIVLIHR